MINFRVSDLDAMVAQLRAAGIDVEPGPDEEAGRFARTWDPEGNPVGCGSRAIAAAAAASMTACAIGTPPRTR